MEKFLVGDEWRAGVSEPFQSINPTDGSVVAEIAQASEADVNDAVLAAKDAVSRPGWRDMPAHQRARLMHRMADLIEREAEPLAQLQTKDNGKTIAESRFQSRIAAEMFRYFAAVAETAESTVFPPRGNYFAYGAYEPIGVVAAITPWNSPITLEAQKLAPAIAAGNAVVMKSSEVTPLVGLTYARLALEAGFPPGIVNVVTGFGGTVGKALVAHPDVGMVTFTGGTRSGLEIGKVAAERIIPCLLELGGKSPNIIFEDADLDEALAGALYGIFSNAGQSCIAGSRVFVQASIYDRFVERFVEAARVLKVGSPFDPATAIAPVASFAHRDNIERLVRSGIEGGARLLCGGERPSGGIFDVGAYVGPTVLEVKDHQSRIAQDEIFGPVACILKFEDDEDLYRQANDTPYGLACGVWTSDYRRAMRAAARIRSGMVWVNTYKIAETNVPFGGVKQSGVGRECGIEGMRAYQAQKSVYMNLNTKPIGWPPQA